MVNLGGLNMFYYRNNEQYIQTNYPINKNGYIELTKEQFEIEMEKLNQKFEEEKLLAIKKEDYNYGN